MASPKKTCEGFGIASVEELSQLTGKPTRTISHWFTSEPELFKTILIGAAAKKMAEGSNYTADQVISLLELGIKTQQAAEQVVQYRAEQLVI